MSPRLRLLKSFLGPNIQQSAEQTSVSEVEFWAPSLAGVDKIQVVASHLAHRELCRVCNHIRAQRFEEVLGSRRQLIRPQVEGRSLPLHLDG